MPPAGAAALDASECYCAADVSSIHIHRSVGLVSWMYAMIDGRPQAPFAAVCMRYFWQRVGHVCICDPEKRGRLGEYVLSDILDSSRLIMNLNEMPWHEPAMLIRPMTGATVPTRTDIRPLGQWFYISSYPARPDIHNEAHSYPYMPRSHCACRTAPTPDDPSHGGAVPR